MIDQEQKCDTCGASFRDGQDGTYHQLARAELLLEEDAKTCPACEAFVVLASRINRASGAPLTKLPASPCCAQTMKGGDESDALTCSGCFAGFSPRVIAAYAVGLEVLGKGRT